MSVPIDGYKHQVHVDAVYIFLRLAIHETDPLVVLAKQEIERSSILTEPLALWVLMNELRLLHQRQEVNPDAVQPIQ